MATSSITSQVDIVTETEGEMIIRALEEAVCLSNHKYCEGCRYHIPKGSSLATSLLTSNLHGVCNNTETLESTEYVIGTDKCERVKI